MKRWPKKSLRFFEECGRRGGQTRARRLNRLKRSFIAKQAAQSRWQRFRPAPQPFYSVRLQNPAWDDPVFLEEVVSEGGLLEWRELYQHLADRPFGPTAQAVERVLASTQIYGATPLWKGLLMGLQGGFP